MKKTFKKKVTRGIYRSNSKGFGFVMPEQDDEEIFIMKKNAGSAMFGDLVEVEITKDAEKNKCKEGRIIDVLERNSKSIVGRLELQGAFGFVVPIDNKIAIDIFVPKKSLNNAKNDDIVVVEIEKWPNTNNFASKPEGRIIEILGAKGSTGVDVMAIIKSYGIRTDFSHKVISEANALPNFVDDKTVEKEIKKGRRDLRKITTITIDSETAKDLDDAVSLEVLSNGLFKLGVHIADVSYYVSKGSCIDKEALERGTSVYFIDRVVPMLPKILSNGICSLNPHVDRLTMTCEMIINSDGKIIEHEIYESVINTTEKMTYTDVYEIIENRDSELCKKYAHIDNMLMHMKALSLILRKAREERGAIEFEFDESQIIVDELGKAVEVVRVIRNSANEMIEDFMLAANETVAEHFYWFDAPFMYRVHETPTDDKLSMFNKFAINLGYNLENLISPNPKDFQKLLKQAKGTREGQVISVAMLRAMQKARYSASYGIHFGLAAEYYTHFTSPIRRYPDLVVHRLIKQYLKNGKPQNIQKLHSEISEIANKNSESEVIAENAERAVEDIKKFELMKEHVGERFEGIISGVTSFGIFVELENTCEGLVPMNLLQDDYYDYYEEKYCVIGQRTNRTLRLGDRVEIVIVKADDNNYKLEFILADLYDKFKSTQTIANIIKTKKVKNKHKPQYRLHPAKAKNKKKSKKRKR